MVFGIIMVLFQNEELRLNWGIIQSSAQSTPLQIHGGLLSWGCPGDSPGSGVGGKGHWEKLLEVLLRLHPQNIKEAPASQGPAGLPGPASSN